MQRTFKTDRISPSKVLDWGFHFPNSGTLCKLRFNYTHLPNYPILGFSIRGATWLIYAYGGKVYQSGQVPTTCCHRVGRM